MSDEKRLEEEKDEIQDQDLDKVSGGTGVEPSIGEQHIKLSLKVKLTHPDDSKSVPQ